MALLELKGKKGLVIGIANENSIAYGCAKAFHQLGAELALTYLNEKAKPFVAPLAEELGATMLLPCNVQQPEEIAAVFNAIATQWGKLDFLLHSIAFAPKEDLHDRLVAASKEGFLKAMEISCYSFIELSRYAELLMKEGGSLLTVSYYGSEKVVEHYNLMGPVKAALEATTRYLAAELGQKAIRVNALSPGPILTRAASGIDHFDALLAKAKEKAPLHQLVSLEDIGNFAAFLVSDAARSVTGSVHYIDAGYAIVD